MHPVLQVLKNQENKFQHAAWGFLAIAGFFDSLGCCPARDDGANVCFYLQTVCKGKDADATSWTIVPIYRIEVLAVFFKSQHRNLLVSLFFLVFPIFRLLPERADGVGGGFYLGASTQGKACSHNIRDIVST